MQILYVGAFLFLGVYRSGLYFTQKLFKSAGFGMQSAGAIVLGSAIFAVLTIVASATGFFFLLWLSLVPAAILTYNTIRQKNFGQKLKGVNLGGLFAVWGALCCAYAFIGALSYPHPLAIGAVIPSQDFYWNVGNAQSFLLGFPPEDLRFSGTTLTYHYLTELIAAGVSMASGVSCYDIIAFVLPVVVLAGALVCLRELGQTLKFTKWQNFALILLLFCSGCAGMYKLFTQGKSPFNNSFLDHVLTNVNSVGTCLVFLAAYMLFFFAYLQKKQVINAIFAWLSFVLLCMSKGPVGAIVAAATLCVCVIKSKAKSRFWIFGLAISATFAVLFAALFSAGSSSDVAISFTATLSKGYFANILNVLTIKGGAWLAIGVPVLAIAHTALFMPALILPWLFCIVQDLAGFKKADGYRLFCQAMGAGGMLAFLIFDTGGFSQVYFAFAALICLTVLVADALPEIVKWINARGKLMKILAKTLFLSMLIIGVFTAFCFYFSKIFTKLNYAIHPNLYSISENSNKTPLLAGEERAMQWLQNNMQSDELFVTNRMHTSPVTAEGLSNVYTGLSGKRSYMESFRYAENNMGVPYREIERRYDNVMMLFSKDTDCEKASEICTNENIDYIVYCSLFDGNVDALANFDLAWDDKDVKIYNTNTK